MQASKKQIIDFDLESIFYRVKKSWKLDGANVLVTGAGGFLGYYFSQFFIKYFSQLNLSKLTLLDLHDLEETRGWKQKDNKIIFLQGDISLAKINKFDPKSYDVIINLASFASPVAYRLNPIGTLRGSVSTVWNLLDKFSEKADKNSRFQIFSSSEIYGDPDPSKIPTPESYRGNVSCVGPRACYDESKRFIETLGYVYSKDSSFNISVVRPFNNFGPGMRLDDGRLPADVMKAMVNNQKLSMFSDGSPTRSFCYVADAIVGYLLALNYDGFEVFNIGNDTEEISVKDFINRASQVKEKYDLSNLEYELQKSKDDDYLKDNPNRRFPDLSK
ncbi:MAG: NAD-dependent epimerase/dehydratase family protein, partial [Flavobacteriaceae bacterium]|nr:NAD-dependent epimerase/dehydratase family protein [Flavobacteriaceae bacterium]